MTGAEVVGAIKSDPALRHIPVVVVSIVSGEHRGHILGAVDLLQKPIVREELLTTLQRNLPTAQKRILVVDDQEDSRELMRSLLELESFEAMTAASAREGLKVLDEAPCDLVLLDLMMPEMDGFAFLRTLRANPRLRSLAVVVVTAKDLTASETRELRGNTSEVVKKSGDFEQDLKTVLHRLFDEPADDEA
jgi:CheY-like chemotaxis protein